MIRKIVLENFMSHVRTVIEPADALTVLIGPNNCGKSAVIHALELICYNNDATDYVIRHGQKKATVTVETEDEDGAKHIIVWWRKKGTAGYVIDGRTISGRGVPIDLHQYLRMPAIESAAGADPFFVHFGLQKSPIFLLNAKAGDAAQFFATSSDADKLFEMQKKHGQKALAARREKDRLDRDIDQLDGQLAILAPLADISINLAVLQGEYAWISDQQSQAKKMSSDIEVLAQTQAACWIETVRIETLTALYRPPETIDVVPLTQLSIAIGDTEHHVMTHGVQCEILRKLQLPPILDVTVGLSLLCQNLEQAQLRHGVEAEKNCVLSPLYAAPDLFDAASLMQVIGEIESVIVHADRVHAVRQMLLPLVSPPALNDTERLGTTLAGTEAAERHVKRVKAFCLAMKLLVLPPEVIDHAPLKNLISEIEHLRKEAGESLTELKRCEANRSDLYLQIEEWVKENPQCGYCGQDVTAELVLGGDHAHE